ncbi:MAG: DUF5597 domain-containing protein [Clostridiales bacterium]|nr:DUF5597 domain-containing protein [Clostridiales bacterium]
MKISRVFKVNGKPFFPLGGQVKNSSGYNPEELETAWKALEYIRANTVEIPVFWEQVEPIEGQFDFSVVDKLIEEARKRNLRLILLWFATWKNGHMKYTPEWVKRNPARFKRVITHDGEAIPTLSSHCKANWEADRKAFCSFIKHLYEKDKDNQTVIAVQIENEPGIVGSDRDYGPEGDRDFKSSVPSVLIELISEKEGSPVHSIWKQCGSKKEGSWPEVFGRWAGELMTAWSIARYIDGLAVAGKEIYPEIPMYVNAWLDGGEWNMAGLNYPSGSPVTSTLDIWKWAAPHIDLIAPDIYRGDHKAYLNACQLYSREDNPLFVPESGASESNALNMFYALADYNAIGYHIFGIEQIVDDDGSLRPEAEKIAGSFQAVSAALPLLIEYQGTGRIHAVVQEEFKSMQILDLGRYVGLVKFYQVVPHSQKLGAISWLDYRHNPAKLVNERGRGLVIQAGEHEFYVLGAGFQLFLHKKDAPYNMLTATQASPFLQRELIDYVRVEEGCFDEEGKWVTIRRRNGDETDFNGIWVQPDVGVVHVVLNDAI